MPWSATRPDRRTLRVALERGMPVDFFGDYLYNKTHHRRPHDGVLAAWADAMRAPANAPVVHGDKERPELTRQSKLQNMCEPAPMMLKE